MTGPGTAEEASRVLVAAGAFVVLGPGVPNDLAAALGGALRDPDPLATVAGLLASNLRELPTVAAVFSEGDDHRLLLRGAVAEAVDHDGLAAILDGQALSTWAEHLVTGATELRVSIMGAAAVVVSVGTASAARSTPTTAPPRPVRRRQLAAKRPPAVPATAEPQLQPAELAGGPELRPVEETIDSGDLPERPIGDVDDPDPGAVSGFDFGHLLDETHFRDVEEAAVRGATDELIASSPAPAPPLTPAPPVGDAASPAPGGGLIDEVPSAPGGAAARIESYDDATGDHDGHTVTVSSLRRRGALAAAGSAAPAAPTVHAVRCAVGHPNPTSAPACIRCGASIPDRTPQLVPRPSMGRLRFDDGTVVEIDRTLFLGRNPKAAVDVPPDVGVIVVPDPEKNLSRLHLEVRVEEWHVSLVDRRSSNGSLVELPGEAPVQLRPDEPFLIVPGTRVELGGVTTFVYEPAV